MVPVEVQGQGTPVIGLRRGGLRETVIASGPAPTGLFFDTAEPEVIAAAVKQFNQERHRFTRVACHRNAERFSEAHFDAQFTAFVEREHDAFRHRMSMGYAEATARSVSAGPTLDVSDYRVDRDLAHAEQTSAT